METREIYDLLNARFDKLERKLDVYAAELNRNIQTTVVLEERLYHNTQFLVDMKDKIIPEKIQAGINKAQLSLYISISSVLVSTIVSILLKYFF
jgi:hypothetical protein